MLIFSLIIIWSSQKFCLPQFSKNIPSYSSTEPRVGILRKIRMLVLSEKFLSYFSPHIRDIPEWRGRAA